MERYKDNLYFLTDRNDILEHFDDVKKLLEQTYWARERSVEVIQLSINNSLCFAILDGTSNKIIAFARVVTDYATMYYLADVIVDEDYRGKGIGKALIERITIAENELQNMYGILLTSNAHKLYSQYGFTKIEGKCMCKS